MYSNVHTLGVCSFPEWKGERHYMIGFKKKEGLPAELARWQPTVDAMLENVNTDDIIYFMADEGIVRANNFHRRPGAHIDMCWHPGVGHEGRHTGIIGCHGTRRRHTPRPGWPTHTPPTHSASGDKEALILASSTGHALGYVGEWDGNFDPETGSCVHINFGQLSPVYMEPNKIYAGDTMQMVHESLPFSETTMRTLVRLNVKGWLPS